MPNPFDDKKETVGEFQQRALAWIGTYLFEIQDALQTKCRLLNKD